MTQKCFSIMHFPELLINVSSNFYVMTAIRISFFLMWAWRQTVHTHFVTNIWMRYFNKLLDSPSKPTKHLEHFQFTKIKHICRNGAKWNIMQLWKLPFQFSGSKLALYPCGNPTLWENKSLKSEIADPIQLKAFGTVDTHKTDREQIENKKKVIKSKEIRDKEILGDINKKRIGSPHHI